MSEQSRYPSPTQIEAYGGEEVQFSDELISLVMDWKKKTWYPLKRDGVFGKMYALYILVQLLNEHYDMSIRMDIGPDCYQPTKKRILLVSPSVITTLHEFGHALFGDDELRACAYSVHLFKRTFPKAWEQLTWDGHVLRRKVIPEGQTVEDVAGMEPDEEVSNG